MEQAMETSVNHYVNADNENNANETDNLDNATQPSSEQTASGVDVNIDPASGAGEATAKEAPSTEEQGTIEPPQTQDAAEKIVSNAGLNMQDFETEYISNGELSKESYEKLEKAGIPKVMVDAYIAGQEAVTQKVINDVYDVAGGSQAYADMCTWAEANVSKEDLQAYNSVMASGKKELIMLAVAGMTHRWKGAVGAEPKLTQGRVSPPAKTAKGFASSAEMVKAMQDKRYGRDPAYTRSVEQKVAASTFFG